MLLTAVVERSETDEVFAQGPCVGYFVRLSNPTFCADRQHNVRLLDIFRRPAATYITGAVRTTPTKALFAMLDWVSTMFLAKQTAKFAAIKLNTLSCWHIVPSGHSTLLEVDPVVSVNIDYLPDEYCFDRDFPFLILCMNDWNPNISTCKSSIYILNSIMGNWTWIFFCVRRTTAACFRWKRWKFTGKLNGSLPTVLL